MPLRKTLEIHSHSVYATSLCIHNPFKQLGQLASKLSVRGQALWMTKNMLFHAEKTRSFVEVGRFEVAL